MEKTYSRINWENFPSVATPINDKNLNKIDEALNEVDNRVLGLDTAKLDKSTANSMVKDVTFDSETGVITIAYLNGSTKKIDTLLEKIIVNYRYDSATQKMILIMQDGTELPIDLSAFITPNEFVNSDTIAHTVDANGKVTSNVVDGSITEKKLEPNYLAKIKVETSSSLANKQAAESSATRSTEKALESKSYAIGGTGTRNGENTDNAKYYSEQAKKHYENASAVTGVEIAKKDRAGIIKGGKNYIAEDGTLTLTMETTDKTMYNSHGGGIKVIEIGGKTEQRTTTGAQLFDADNPTLNATLDYGNVTHNENYNLYAIPVTVGESYTMSKSAFTNGAYIGFYGEIPSIGATLTDRNLITTTEKLTVIATDNYLCLMFSKSDNINTVMLNKGTEALPFEPYTGKKPSPSPEYPQEIKKVKGKNLLENTLTSRSKNGVDITVNEDKSITLNGKCTEWFFINLNYVDATTRYLPNGKYIVSGGNSNAFLNVFVDGTSVAHSYKNAEFTLTNSNKQDYVRLEVSSGSEFNNYTIYPMIRPASVKDSTYVPYGLLRIKTVGENFFGGEALADKIVSVFGGVKDISAKTVTYNAVSVGGKVLLENTFKENTPYTIILYGTNTNNQYSETNIVVKYTDDTRSQNLVFTSKGELSYCIFKTDANKTIQSIRGVYAAYSTTLHYEKCGVFEGEIALEDFVPYQESSITFTNPITLNGIGDVQDRIVRKDGVFGTYRELRERVFNGSEQWGLMTDNGNQFSTTSLSDNGAIEFLCTHFRNSGVANWVKVPDMTYMVNNSNLQIVRFRYDACTTVDEWKAWLSENNVTVVYKTTEPTFEPLPTADQIALNSLLSFDGVTYLHFDSEIEPTSLVEYGTSHVGAMTLEAWNKAENSRIRVEEILTMQTE